jgi:hypothetical protein
MLLAQSRVGYKLLNERSKARDVQGRRKQYDSAKLVWIIPEEDPLDMLSLNDIVPNAEVPSFTSHIDSRLVQVLSIPPHNSSLRFKVTELRLPRSPEMKVIFHS